MALIGKEIDLAIKLLNEGEVIGIPTETVYGLAGNALNIDAVTKIFEVKNRPTFDPLIVHIAGFDNLAKFVKAIPVKAIALIEKFSPGPLTLLLPKQENIPDLVTSGLDTVAVRIPNHPLTLQLLKNLSFPLAAPSANPFGYISPTTAQHVDNQLGSRIKYILDGGECKVGIESTIVGFFEDEVIVYRKGGLAIEAIEKVVGKVKIQSHSSSNPKAPGMLKSHYSPTKQLSIINEQLSINKILNLKSKKQHSDLNNVSKGALNLKKIGFLGFDKYQPTIPLENQLLLSPSADFSEAAKNLFSYMRLLDAMPIEEILTELLPEKDLGRAINDRIKRAAAV